jgi:formylglycine-generating enzyme required for sulfatase activity
VAFCRWLSARLRANGRIDPDWEIRLPKEWEWQQAATGGDNAHVYPWGREYESGLANIDETSGFDPRGAEYLGRTSAVGLYRAGASPQGVYDLAGNVWEWCANKFEDPRLTQIDESYDSRVLRGGAWSNQASDARAAYRLDSIPNLRYDFAGFRVLCSPPSSGTDH